VVRLTTKDYLLGLFFWLGAAALFAHGSNLEKQYLLWRQGQATEATILRVGAPERNHLHFEFEVGSRKISGKSNASRPGLHVDDKVGVVYLPSDPTINAVTNDPRRDFVDNVLFVLVGSMVGAGILLAATLARRDRAFSVESPIPRG
jgi:hypothetical protein